MVQSEFSLSNLVVKINFKCGKCMADDILNPFPLFYSRNNFKMYILPLLDAHINLFA